MASRSDKRDIMYPQTDGSVAWDRYITDHCLTNDEAGSLVGASGVTAYHWRIGAKVPRPANRKRIELATRGLEGRHVTPGIQPVAWVTDVLDARAA